MCGRFVSDLAPAEVAALFEVVAPLPNAAPSWNMAPTMQALVVRHHRASGERRLDLLRWGLLPHFIKDPKAARRPINARAETVRSLPLFRLAFAQRRCLVPATAFYEWRAEPDGKQPFAVARADGAPMALAGLWESWTAPEGEVLRSFTIVTTTANAEMSALHERMPVILERDAWAPWLDGAPDAAAGLMRPAPDGTLRLWPVSRRVNSVRNDGPELLSPFALPEPEPAPAGANPA
ncbi:MAG: SOS response-associated peptidase [Janthinobacterium lividum]